MPNTRTLRARLGGLALAAAAAVAACSTDVHNPSIVAPDGLQTAAAIPTLVAGATGDFAFAYAGDNGGTEGVVLLGGLRADEYRNSDYFDTRIQVDRGVININNASVGAVFANLNRARRSAELATSTLAKLAPADYRRAAALNLDAYTYVLLAETFCSGIPFTELAANGTSLAYGAPLTTQQVFQIAKARFDTAVTIADASAKTGNARAQQEAYLARVGRARAFVGLGLYDSAAASVATVPANFEYDMQYSENTGRENNGVYGFNVVNQRWSVANNEGMNGLPFISAKDPRVPVSDAGITGVDAATELFTFDKYSSLSSSIPLATGVEAQLIIAEASLNGKLAGGGRADAVSRLNQLRASLAAGLDTLTLGPDLATQARQLVSDRAFWLFATGHRLGDMRRLVRPPSTGGYGLAITSVFPTGPYPKGGAPYGQEVNLPIPVDELNNPNFKQCIDRST